MRPFSLRAPFGAFIFPALACVALAGPLQAGDGSSSGGGSPSAPRSLLFTVPATKPFPDAAAGDAFQPVRAFLAERLHDGGLVALRSGVLVAPGAGWAGRPVVCAVFPRGTDVLALQDAWVAQGHAGFDVGVGGGSCPDVVTDYSLDDAQNPVEDLFRCEKDPFPASVQIIVRRDLTSGSYAALVTPQTRAGAPTETVPLAAPATASGSVVFRDAANGGKTLTLHVNLGRMLPGGEFVRYEARLHQAQGDTRMACAKGME